MPRPRKCRRICELPDAQGFEPIGKVSEEMIVLNIDEYEVIRLLDYEKLTQEQCALQMNVARTTITKIYDQARYKLSDALLNRKKLLVSGGDVLLCPKSETCCKKSCCHDCSVQKVCKKI